MCRLRRFGGLGGAEARGVHVAGRPSSGLPPSALPSTPSAGLLSASGSLSACERAGLQGLRIWLLDPFVLDEAMTRSFPNRRDTLQLVFPSPFSLPSITLTSSSVPLSWRLAQVIFRNGTHLMPRRFCTTRGEQFPLHRQPLPPSVLLHSPCALIQISGRVLRRVRHVGVR